MPNPPPRMRFQFHLSTAIVMMFVAGALMWANSVKYFDYPHPMEGYRGWPVIMYYADRPVNAQSNSFVYSMVLLNAIIALAILLAVWFLCEWLIRRRAARKGA